MIKRKKIETVDPRPYVEEATPPLPDITEAIRGVTNVLRGAQLQGIVSDDDSHGALLAISILNAQLHVRLP